MKKTNILKLAAAFAFLLLMFLGCTKEQPEGEFDIDVVSQKIVMNGLNIKLPFTLSELGNNYYFGLSIDFGTGRKHTLSELKYGTKSQVTVKSEPFETVESENARIYKMEYFSTDDVSIDGIAKGAHISEAIKKWGEADRSYDTDGYKYKEYAYMYDWENYVILETNKDGIITNITIEYAKSLYGTEE